MVSRPVVRKRKRSARKRRYPVPYVGFRLADLAGSVPPNHRPFRHSATGKPLLLKGQIWVDMATDELWEIVALPSPDARPMNRFFTLSLYGGFWKRQKKVRDSRIEQDFQPLEKAIVACQERLAQLRRQYEAGGPGTERFHDFAAFAKAAGIHPETGFRISN